MALAKRLTGSGSLMDENFKPQSPTHRGSRLRFLVALFVLAGFAMLSQEARAQFAEYEVKAAFLSSFAKFTKWPAATFSDKNAPFVIGILGSDPFGGALERKALEQTVSGRKVVIHRGRNVTDMRGCQVVFIAKSERSRIGDILAAIQNLAGLQGSPILTVGETDQFTRQSGMIGFRMDEDQVRFDINSAAAQRAGLQISSQLLKLDR